MEFIAKFNVSIYCEDVNFDLLLEDVDTEELAFEAAQSFIFNDDCKWYAASVIRRTPHPYITIEIAHSHDITAMEDGNYSFEMHWNK